MDDPLVAVDPADEIELQDAGSTFSLGLEGWEASDYTDPEDDWKLLSDGSYLSPDGLTRTWPIAGPEPS
jgi:hypothetical protein